MNWLVVPSRYEGLPGAGQWKDLHGLRLALDRLGIDWGEFRFDGANIGELADRIGDADDTAIWYYTFWPEAMAELRHRCPRVRMALRTVNAEAFQHWLRARKDWTRIRGLPRDVYGFCRLLWRDRRCARMADALAGISPWDDARYWRRLAGHRKVFPAPYLCPWPVLWPAVRPRPWTEREDRIVCLAGARDAIGHGHLAEFAALARRPEWTGWGFAASQGLIGDSHDDLPGNVERLGRLDEPWSLLCRVKAVAVLSPVGYGFKTTITDALAAGCHVLVHPRQHERLAPEDRCRTRSCDPVTADISALAAALSSPPELTAAGAQAEQLERTIGAWRQVLAECTGPEIAQ
jgi:hypothetical protein